jgi:hypothetical protein
MLAVPCGPAASGAEPGVLAARHERGAALLTVPDISHRAMLCVACAAAPDTAAWKPPSAAAIDLVRKWNLSWAGGSDRRRVGAGGFWVMVTAIYLAVARISPVSGSTGWMVTW